MPRDDQSIQDACQNCGAAALICRFNQFESDTLQIRTWEHRCRDCGTRETRAYRSDEADQWEGTDPRICPFCGRAPNA